MLVGKISKKYGEQHDHEKLPKNLRIMSVVSIAIFTFALITVLERAGLITIFNITEVFFIYNWLDHLIEMTLKHIDIIN